MSKTVAISASSYLPAYDSIALKIKTSQPFKVSAQVHTSDDGEYWVNYSSTHTGPPFYDEESGMIEAAMGSAVTNGQWNTVELNVQATLDEEALSRDQTPLTLDYITKISLLGSNFGIKYINIFYTDYQGTAKYQPIDTNHGGDNFGLPDIDPPGYQERWRGWDLTDPDYFSIQYDGNITGYLQAVGPLAESSQGGASGSQSAGLPIYSPTDLGSSYYSPYSAMGGYYDNYYGMSSWYGSGYYGGYGGYGGYYGGYGYPGYGYGMGLGYYDMAGLYGYGLGGYGLGGYGLGGYGYPSPLYGLGSALSGYGLPYSSYGYPYSLYGGALGSPLGTGLSSLVGAGVGTSPLLSGVTSSSLFGDIGLSALLADLPTNNISLPTLVPSTSQVSLSSILGLSGLGITGLSDLTIPVTTYTPGSSTISLPTLSSFLPPATLI